MPPSKKRPHERQSTRIFGEYAFLEDSRYASQPKNISGRIRREWSEQPRGGVLWAEAEGRGTFQRADLCDAFIKVVAVGTIRDSGTRKLL
jgi:hypothetical protein